MKEHRRVFTTQIHLLHKIKRRRSVAQNSVIRIEVIDPLGVKTKYHGYIQDIWELDYGARMQIHIFRCQWVKHPNGVRMQICVDSCGLTLVDWKHVSDQDDSWVLAD
jgi:hypothetical protein